MDWTKKGKTWEGIHGWGQQCGDSLRVVWVEVEESIGGISGDGKKKNIYPNKQRKLYTNN